MRMRFHWILPAETDPVTFCRTAEAAGIDQALLPAAFQRPDPVAPATHIASATKEIGLMVCPRTDMRSPTHLVRQVNTVSAVTNGRVSVVGVASLAGSARGPNRLVCPPRLNSACFGGAARFPGVR
ncbi:LLM class flavin-dependent oxidoreductase [Kutzneria sp. CA-103260]|uniref:LLM class flavin-dependent oxidoreductase n=1 Tax=Kutzneria sp. CA-103260 TaxID=2802641 RepID=UPI001BA93EAE|nr:LLM class flavin-dependent oxidoreductase [Kutzneria sp. CA-103260]QUQ67844.1 Alkanesulfonate monooxygenase [Kutzneria sp. CA-103260]